MKSFSEENEQKIMFLYFCGEKNPNQQTFDFFYFFPFPGKKIYDIVLFEFLLVLSSKSVARFLFRNILLHSNSRGEKHKFY